MPIVDSPPFRERLTHFFPGIRIETNLRPSGQRLVYFCTFSPTSSIESQRGWATWGPVVLKISDDVHPTVIARIEKEKQILESLNSTYFPKHLHYEVFATDPATEERLNSRLFFTIEERVPAVPLSTCKARFSHELRSIQLLKELATALSLLWNHPQRIVHRDLKPDNILIRDDDSPVIIDLGIAREQGAAGVTGTGWPIGPCSPAYASPEQIRNEKRAISFKSDFFSLGVLMYELLSGNNPFADSSDEPASTVLQRAMTFNPPTLLSIGKASPRLSSLVEKLMSKPPYKRPRTVKDFLTELNALNKEVQE